MGVSKHFLFFFGFLFVVSLACGPTLSTPEADRPTETRRPPQPEPTRVATEAPTREATQDPTGTPATLPTETADTQTPQIDPTEEAVALASLKSELYLGFGGNGVFNLCEEVVSPPESGVSLPAFGASYYYGDRALICLYDFHPEEEISVTLVGPEGDFSSSSVNPCNAEDLGRFNACHIVLWWPANMSSGPWQLEAKSDSSFVQGSFEILAQSPRITILADEDSNPFDERSKGYWEYSYAEGDTVLIAGSEFPSETVVSLGVYNQTDQTNEFLEPLMELADFQLVESDAQGRFATSITLTLPPEELFFPIQCIVAMTEGENTSYFHLQDEVACFSIEE